MGHEQQTEKRIYRVSWILVPLLELFLIGPCIALWTPNPATARALLLCGIGLVAYWPILRASSRAELDDDGLRIYSMTGKLQRRIERGHIHGAEITSGSDPEFIVKAVGGDYQIRNHYEKRNDLLRQLQGIGRENQRESPNGLRVSR